MTGGGLQATRVGITTYKWFFACLTKLGGVEGGAQEDVEVVVVNEEDVEAIIVISEKVVESVLVNDKDVKPANVNDEVIEVAIVNDKDVKVVDVNDEVMKVVVLNYKDVEVEARDAKNEVASIVDGDVNGGDDIGDKRGVEFRKEGLDESEEKLHKDDDDDD
ncbi:hypothetical protein DEO72_LG9g1285 [Vigna unguiculata]|uniref:Uncharacterized protein n=1 Tax=Vigna unguiculata TaxID=3917 RepID=A0A4D6N054_VIGUN|nr:hypothetical protein DEO72_LG9g1285 [Vigna unguiculata]